MGFLSISLLGGLQVKLDDQPVDEFEYNKVRGLLAFLAVENGKPHHREVIADFFWPERPAQSARNSLRQALSILRNITGDRDSDIPFFTVTRDFIQFNAKSNHFLDVTTFLDSIHVCRESLKRGEKPGTFCIHWLNQAIRLYKGDFLNQFMLTDSEQFENWKILKRNEYKRYILEALEIIAAFYEDQGDFHETIRTAQKQLDLDPMREESHRRLMRMHYILGSRSEIISQYEQCRRILIKDLGVEPEEETKILYEKLMRIDSAVPENQEKTAAAPDMAETLYSGSLFSVFGNSDLQSFTGRESELRNLSELLRSGENRLISITGKSGTGKTSLMQKAAAENLSLFPDGIYYLDFSRYPNYEKPSVVIREGTGLPPGNSPDTDSYLINFIKKKKLLYLFDDPWDSAATGQLAERIIQRAPGVKIITAGVAKSRFFPVGAEIKLEGLRYPDGNDSPDAAESFPSVIFFTKCARRFLPDFHLNEQIKKEAAGICNLLKGEPLAIELAASWLRMLSPADIRRELKDFLDRNPARSELWAAREFTWSLLTEQEMAVFRRLSVFQGSFSREAAERVCDVRLPLLSSLAGRSLLRIDFSGRYTINEVIRKSVQLPPSENEELRLRHSEYYLSFLGAAEDELYGPGQKNITDTIKEEIINIRQAWGFALKRNDLSGIERSFRAFALYLDLTGSYEEGNYWFSETGGIRKNEAPESGDDAVLRDRIFGQIRAVHGWFLIRLGKTEEARRQIQQSFQTLEQIRTMPSSGWAWPLFIQGFWFLRTNRLKEAELSFEKSLSQYMRSSNLWCSGMVQLYLGITAVKSGDAARAAQFFKEGLRTASETGEKRLTAMILQNSARLSVKKEEYSKAELLLKECIELLEEAGDGTGIACCLMSLSSIYLKRRDISGAKKLLNKSIDIYKEYHDLSGLTQSVNLMAKLEAESGSAADAFRHYRKGLELARDIQSVSQSIEAMHGIALLTDLEGDSETAYMYMHHITALAESNHKSRAAEYREYMNELEQGLDPSRREELISASESLGINQIVAQMLSDSQNASGSS